MDRVETAVSCFKEGFSCSQAILSTYGPQYGLNPGDALRISTGFGGGIARTGGVCGAATGAFMVIGLKHGRKNIEDELEKEKTYKLINEFVNIFTTRNGSIVCKELLGSNISTSEGMKIVEEKKLIATLCPKLVKDAAGIIERLLQMNLDNIGEKYVL